MPQVSNATSTQYAAKTDPVAKEHSINDLDMDDFLDLMITQLKNQDPLNPLDNEQMLAQISQIRTVGATDKLTSTLDAVLLGQNISSATNLIGANIDALSDDGQRVSGVVDRISVSKGQPKLHLDLNPSGKVDKDESGNLEQGAYRYLAVWQEEGQLFGVDPLANQGGQLLVGDTGGSAALLSNLPPSTSIKQIYRTDRTGQGDYKLVGSLTDVNQATFLDTAADGERGPAVLSATPQMVTPKRSFTVSLKNIAEIRPPN